MIGLNRKTHFVFKKMLIKCRFYAFSLALIGFMLGASSCSVTKLSSGSSSSSDKTHPGKHSASSPFAGWGGTETAMIYGKVVDSETDQRIPGVDVRLTSKVVSRPEASNDTIAADTSTRETFSVTNQNGRFAFVNVPPGKYVIEVSFVGFKPKLVQDGVRVGHVRRETVSITPKPDSLLN